MAQIGNALAALPKSAHPAAKAALAEIYNAEDKTHARAAAKAFAAEFGAKWPKAVAKITDDLDVLAGLLRLPGRALDPPADHEPDRVDLRHRPARTRVTKGPGSRAAGVAMAFKLIEAAQHRWRMVNAPHLVALVRAGALFVNGKLVERPQDQVNKEVVSKRRKTRRSTGLDYSSAIPHPNTASPAHSVRWVCVTPSRTPLMRSQKISLSLADEAEPGNL